MNKSISSARYRLSLINKMIPLNRLDVAILVVLVLATCYLEANGKARIQTIDLKEESLMKPRLKSIVPSKLVILIAFVVPSTIYLLFLKNSSTVLFLLGLLQSNILTLFTTNFLKILVGRPRPFFSTVCKRYISEDSLQCIEGDQHLINDARKSFPSGHSSLSFSSLLFLSLFILKKFYPTFVNPNVNTSKLLPVILICLPISLATLISCSRLIDYHHHYSDVIAGSLLGSFFALMSFITHGGLLNLSSIHIPEKDLDPESVSDSANVAITTTNANVDAVTDQSAHV